MFENRNTAIRVNDNLEQICKLIDQGMEMLSSEQVDEDEKRIYSRLMSKVLGTEILEIQSEIWRHHPDLIPPGARPWPPR